MIVLVVALTGANIAQQGGLAATVVANQAGAPQTELFSNVFWFFWLPTAGLATFAGLWGGYRALCEGNLSNGWLTLFAVLFSIVLKVDGLELGWSYLRFAINFTVGRIGLGVNVVGIILLATLWVERGRSTGVPSRASSPGGDLGAGAV
jgi:hypothetical protein